MTSKEALEKMKELWEHNYWSTAYIDWNALERAIKDLEVLEVLKKYLYISGDSCGDVIKLKWDGIDSIANKNDFNKIKEWKNNK